MNINKTVDKYLNEAKQKLDIPFIKSVAIDSGHSISDKDAKKAHKEANMYSSNGQDYYDQLKQYFS